MRYNFGFLFALFSAVLGSPAVARVATTVGDNMTAFQGTGVTNNNQWNNLTNARTQVASAKVEASRDNCGAVVLRCASPKCANGGCTDIAIARPIVANCVAANKGCQQYGDSFIDGIAAQVMAQSVAKAREQQNAVEMAQANAAAVAAQNDRTADDLRRQMEEMKSQMQETLDEMKNQPAPTPVEPSESVSAASASSASNNPLITGDGPIATAQQIAYANGIDDPNILVREQVAGEVETQIENASTQLKELKRTLDEIIAYAGCDANVNNCTGPKRVKKFKEMANNFFEPYENVVENLYESLLTAMGAGIDVQDVIMFLTNSCNRWGKYLCGSCDDGNPGCKCQSQDWNGNYNRTCYWDPYSTEGMAHCQFLTFLTDSDTVQREWIDPNSGITGAVRLKCVSDVALGAPLFRSVSMKKNATMDIENLRNLINQDSYTTCRTPVGAGSTKPEDIVYSAEDCGMDVCMVTRETHPERWNALEKFAGLGGRKFPSNICYGTRTAMRNATGSADVQKDDEEGVKLRQSLSNSSTYSGTNISSNVGKKLGEDFVKQIKEPITSGTSCIGLDFSGCNTFKDECEWVVEIGTNGNGHCQKRFNMGFLKKGLFE